MTRSLLKRLTEEDRFARYCVTWTQNHSGWAKSARANRRLAKRRLDRIVLREISDDLFYGKGEKIYGRNQ